MQNTQFIILNLTYTTSMLLLLTKIPHFLRADRAKDREEQCPGSKSPPSKTVRLPGGTISSSDHAAVCNDQCKTQSHDYVKEVAPQE